MACECIAVYVDQRFRSERCVDQRILDAGPTGIGVAAQSLDEPTLLHHTVVSLLRICKRSKSDPHLLGRSTEVVETQF